MPRFVRVRYIAEIVQEVSVEEGVGAKDINEDDLDVSEYIECEILEIKSRFLMTRGAE